MKRAKAKARRLVVMIMGAVGLTLVVLILGNRRSLQEGLRYLHHMLTFEQQPDHPIDSQGAFGVCDKLVRLDNRGRYDTILQRVRDLGLEPAPIPLPDVPDAPPNLLVRLGDRGREPYTLFVAHYDKTRATPRYQGASDNTAAVCVFLAALEELAARPPERPVALLFTSAEERGALGAKAFVTWAEAQAMPIREVIVMDMIGRGKVASRPAALPGFHFWLPILGPMVYDGRIVRAGEPYPPVDPQLLARLERVLGDDLVIYRRFTAYGDANIFQDAGYPVVSLSSDNMYYLDLVWEREADRIELLDQRHLALVEQFIVDYSRGQP